MKRVLSRDLISTVSFGYSVHINEDRNMLQLQFGWSVILNWLLGIRNAIFYFILFHFQFPTILDRSKLYQIGWDIRMMIKQPWVPYRPHLYHFISPVLLKFSSSLATRGGRCHLHHTSSNVIPGAGGGLVVSWCTQGLQSSMIWCWDLASCSQ